jgi:hypothetical protein
VINEGGQVEDKVLDVISGVTLKGQVNTADRALLENVRYAIRRGHKQVRPQSPTYDRVALVGGGPSLEDSVDELRQAYFEGAKVVTMNGAYHWCIDRNIRPSMQVVMDARPHNARFVLPEIPQCYYLLASQCAPEVWNAVDDHERVWIFHAVTGADPDMKAELDDYYLGNWVSIAGGTTVFTRSLSLLRTIVDSCWRDGESHAYAQPENASDRKLPFTVHPEGHPDMARTFWCSPWHIQQVTDFLQMIRVNGQHFLINIHGDGLLKYVLESCAGAAVIEESATT